MSCRPTSPSYLASTSPRSTSYYVTSCWCTSYAKTSRDLSCFLDPITSITPSSRTLRTCPSSCWPNPSTTSSSASCWPTCTRPILDYVKYGKRNSQSCLTRILWSWRNCVTPNSTSSSCSPPARWIYTSWITCPTITLCWLARQYLYPVTSSKNRGSKR